MGAKEELQKIYDQHGQLTPELVVQVARPKAHPLHSHVFDRGPKEAAEAWYRHRAHELIQTIRITYRDNNDKPLDIRAWHAVRGETGYVYEPAEKIAQNEFQSRLVLQDMEREWRQLKNRYETFREFWEMVNREAKAA